MSVAVAHAVPAARYRFFLVWAWLLLLVAVTGFGPTFVVRPWSGAIDYATGAQTLPLHLVLHGCTLLAWYACLAIQATLVASGHVHLHRRLGKFGAVVAVAVVVSTIPTLAGFLPRVDAGLVLMHATPAQAALAMPRVASIVVPGSVGLLLFSILVAAAIRWRRWPDAHRRLMLFASLTIIGPALSPARLFGGVLASFPGPLLLFAMLAICAGYDLYTQRRLHRATGWSLAGIAIWLLAGTPPVVSSTAAASYVRWLSEVAG